MISIYSNFFDESTDIVINWIHSFGNFFFRCNEFSVNEYDRIISQINNNENKSVWYRKINLIPPKGNGKILSSLGNEIDRHCFKELVAIYFSFIDNYCEKKLGSFENINYNKIKILSIARLIGFSTPATIIVNKKRDLIEFNKLYPHLITKCASDAEMYSIDNIRFAMYTSTLSTVFINDLPEYFFPSLVQEQIDKDFELRVFYLDGICYSMAIFSQVDTQTSIDYRNYNLNNPNRTVPFNLPSSINEKINKLMTLLKFNTGSLDFIVSKEGVFYFLEVNPVGQFNNLSVSCNYQLEKKIAQWLIK